MPDKGSTDLYKSTYNGEEADSDRDEFHITMPFKRSAESHKELLSYPTFEADENYEMEGDEKNKLFQEIYTESSKVLHTLHCVLRKLANSFDPAKKTE